MRWWIIMNVDVGLLNLGVCCFLLTGRLRQVFNLFRAIRITVLGLVNDWGAAHIDRPTKCWSLVLNTIIPEKLWKL